MDKWCIPPKKDRGTTLDEDNQGYTFFDDMEQNPEI
jgi:hypothetical protein